MGRNGRAKDGIWWGEMVGQKIEFGGAKCQIWWGNEKKIRATREDLFAPPNQICFLRPCIEGTIASSDCSRYVVTEIKFVIDKDSQHFDR